MKKESSIFWNFFIFMGVILVLATGCEKEKLQNYSIIGKAQKGPFVTGANVTINELNDKLDQTGRSFSSSIGNDDGSFSLNSVELEFEIALVTVNGYYYDEVANELPSGTLNLQALTDISGKTSVNVNVMTHVLKNRVENLFKSGLSFNEANRKAKDELVSILFGESGSNVRDFDQLDIASAGNDNALLLAFSVMTLRYFYSTPALLTEFLTKLRTDFGENGEINNPDLLKDIWNNVRFLNPMTVNDNLANRYQQIGVNANLPDFQNYINKYVEKFAPELNPDFQYPNITYLANHSNDPVAYEVEYLNILDKDLTTVNVSSTMEIHLAATTPLNKTLKIRITPEGSWSFSCPPLNQPGGLNQFMYFGGGWYVEQYDSNSVILLAQRQNLPVSAALPFCLIPHNHSAPPNPIKIEYFENELSTPSFTKIVTFTN